MRITRLNLVLFALVLVFYLMALHEAGPSLTRQITNRAFAAFDPDVILRVSLTDQSDPGALRLVLARPSKDEPWGVEARSGYPAEVYPLEALFACIVNLRERDQVAETAESSAVFGLGKDMGVAIEMAMPGGTPWRFILGDSLGKAGGFLRAASESRVFRAPGFAGLSLLPRQWIAPKLFRFDASLTWRVEIQLAGTGLSFARNDKGIWRETETGASAPRVVLEDLIGDLNALVLSDLASGPMTPEETGFGKSLPKVLLFGEGGESLAQLSLGRAGASGERMVRAGWWREKGHLDWIGLVAAPLAESIMQRVSAIIAFLDGA